MPRRASGTEWINCTHPRQLRTADVRRIISVNAQLSRRRSSGKVANPKKLKSTSDGTTAPGRRRSSKNTKVEDARYEEQIDKVLADRDDDDRSPVSERETTPESVPSLSRTNSVNSDDILSVKTELAIEGPHKMNQTVLVVDSDTNSFSLSRSNSPSSSSPKSLLDSGLLDPFSTGIVPISREMNDLLLHLVFIMVPPKKLCEQQPWHQFCPVISNWARTAVGPVALPEHYLSIMAILSNAMLQYAVCGLAAAHVHFLQGHLKREYDARIDEPFRHRPMLVDCLFYQGKVMEELHKHLVGKDDFADICSVVSTMCLLAMSVYFGVREEIAAHINGMANIVKARGGWHVIPLDVAQIYLCTIYLSAIWTESVPPEPPIPPTESEYSDALLMKENPPALASLGESLIESKDALLLDEELIDLIRQVQYVTRYREYCLGHGYRVTSQEVEIFTLRRLDLEYRIMHRLFGPDTINEDPRHISLEISLLIFSIVNLELLNTSAGPFRTLSKLLRASLNGPDILTAWWEAPDVLMWILFMGAHISVHPKERLWYLYRLAHLPARLGLHNWQEARQMLTGCFYVDRVHEDSFIQIWNEATRLGGHYLT